MGNFTEMRVVLMGPMLTKRRLKKVRKKGGEVNVNCVRPHPTMSGKEKPKQFQTAVFMKKV